MKPLWIGDRKDRVKWASLVHLARREAIQRILVGPFLRDDTPRHLQSTAAAEPVPLATEVWSHFSDPDHHLRLAAAARLRIDQFGGHSWTLPRQTYLDAAREWVLDHRVPKVLLLDPDTGLEPDSGAGLQHVKRSEVAQLWNALSKRDWLVLYQHASRTAEWRRGRFDCFCDCCPPGHAESFDAPLIASDVVIYAARR